MNLPASLPRPARSRLPQRAAHHTRLLCLASADTLFIRQDLWVLEATLQDPSVPGIVDIIRRRVKGRAQAASLIVTVSFSLIINGSLDKIGLIDPSTSTVFIGITLGVRPTHPFHP